MLARKSKSPQWPQTPPPPLHNSPACKRCAGLVVHDRDEIRCINCGWHGFFQEPPEPSPHDHAIPLVHSQINQKHGLVKTTASLSFQGKHIEVTLRGNKKGFWGWSKLDRQIIENRLLKSLKNKIAGRCGQRSLKLTGRREGLIALSQLEDQRLRGFLGNLFADPFAHGLLRDKPRRGNSADPNLMLFWQTARDIAGPLREWLLNCDEGDQVYSSIFSIIRKDPRANKKTILPFLIDQNWKNADKKFPEKPAMLNRQFYRYLDKPTCNQFPGNYVHSAGWISNGDQLCKCLGRGPQQLPLSEAGRVLAEQILSGKYILHHFIRVHLTPGI